MTFAPEVLRGVGVRSGAGSVCVWGGGELLCLELSSCLCRLPISHIFVNYLKRDPCPQRLIQGKWKFSLVV